MLSKVILHLNAPEYNELKDTNVYICRSTFGINLGVIVLDGDPMFLLNKLHIPNGIFIFDLAVIIIVEFDL